MLVEHQVAAGPLLEKNEAVISAEPLLLEPISNPAQTEWTTSTLNPPYARFAIIAVGLALIVSVVTFCVADDLARKHIYFGPLILLAGFAALLLIRPVRSSYGVLKRVEEGKEEIQRSRQKLRSLSVFFGAVFALTTGLVGFLIGTSGAETETLIADYQRFNTKGDEISKLRSSAELTVPSQLAMYHKLGTPVREFLKDAVQVKAELMPYDEKYPASHVATQKWIQDMDIAIRRADLLQKQIEAAKLIEGLDPGLRYDAWRTQMQPLWDEEKTLNN